MNTKTKTISIVAIVLVILTTIVIVILLDQRSKPKCPLNMKVKPNYASCMTTEDGHERCWLKHIPNAALEDNETKVPLVIAIHGYNDCSESFAKYSNWLELSNNNGFIVIFPQGLEGIEGSSDKKSSWNAGACCGGGQQMEIDDASFIQKMVEHEVADEKNNIDESKVYVSGHSNGCAMAQRMAVENSNVFAATGCHSFYLIVDVPSSYDAIPFIEVHGEEDDDVAYSDKKWGTKMVGAVSNLKTWSNMNECNQDEPITESYDEYTTTTYTNCKNNANATLVSIPTAGHLPFQNMHQPDYMDQSLPKLQTDTSGLIWNFMNAFSKEKSDD